MARERVCVWLMGKCFDDHTLACCCSRQITAALIAAVVSTEQLSSKKITKTGLNLIGVEFPWFSVTDCHRLDGIVSAGRTLTALVIEFKFSFKQQNYLGFTAALQTSNCGVDY